MDTLTVETTSSASGPRATQMAHNGSYQVSWDEAAGCLWLDGSWNTVVAGLTFSTVVAGYGQCAGQCPDAGGTVDFSGGRVGREVTIAISFDGSADVAWSSNQGRSGTLPLPCAP